MKIEKAIPQDSQKLTELTIRSKTHWAYSDQQIEIWRDDLTISESYIYNREVYKLKIENNIIGYYSYYNMNSLEVKLENLFIEPEFIGKGYGKLLMSDFLMRIQRTESNRIILEADPNAEYFYLKLGFNVIGKIETSIKNRFLPIMEMKLSHLTKPTKDHGRKNHNS